MIPDFIPTVGNDCKELYSYFKTPAKRITSATDLKASLSAIRILATISMAISSSIIFKGIALGLSGATSGLAVLALGVALFAISRDIFVMAKNLTSQSESMLQLAEDLFVSVFNSPDKKRLDHPLTKDTLSPGSWSWLFNSFPQVDPYKYVCATFTK